MSGKFHALDVIDQNHQPVKQHSDKNTELSKQRTKTRKGKLVINDRPLQSSSYQPEDLKTSNHDEWWVDCNDEGNSYPVPAA